MASRFSIRTTVLVVIVAEAMVLLRRVLGPGLHDVSYVVVHDLPRDSWGYGGLTQAARAAQAEAVSPAAAA